MTQLRLSRSPHAHTFDSSHARFGANGGFPYPIQCHALTYDARIVSKRGVSKQLIATGASANDMSAADERPSNMKSESRSEILERIESIARQIVGTPDLHLREESTARDVAGWDSLTHVQIIIGVEQAFGIRLSATEVAQLENAGSLVDAVQYHQANAIGT